MVADTSHPAIVIDANQDPSAAARTITPVAAPFSIGQMLPVLSGQSFPMRAWVGGLVAVVVIGIALAGFVRPANDTAVNSALVLALITGTAVAIERLLEAFWNFEDSTKGAWWPFNVVHDEIERRVQDFYEVVQPYLNRLAGAQKLLNEAHTNDLTWKPTLDAAAADVAALPGQLTSLADNVKKLNLGNDQKLTYLLARTSDSIKAILAAHPDLHEKLGKDVDLAKEMTDDVYAFTSSFKDNPARRIMSIVVGCIAGFVVAVALRLDMFAALGIQQVTVSPLAAWGLGVPLTGLIMGLGSNPTHEIIQAIQQYKQSN
jgi:hypothetical protein